MLPYLYRAFGLTYTCEFEFPELLPVNDNRKSVKPDVHIHFGNVPDHLKNPILSQSKLQINKNQYLIKMDQNVGVRYLVQNGDEIIVQCQDDSEKAVMRLFMLSLCMTAITFQRGRLPIHASAVRVGEYAVLFSGDSGMGKSTLAANFLKRGYEVLTDDVAVIAFDENGTPQVVPGYPRLKLWEDSLENLGEPLDAYRKVRSGAAKYGFPVINGFAKEPLPIGVIYLLEESSLLQIRIQPVDGFGALSALQKKVYRRRILSAMGLQKHEFEQLVALVDCTEVFILERPRQIKQLGELLNHLEEHFLDLGGGR